MPPINELPTIPASDGAVADSSGATLSRNDASHSAMRDASDANPAIDADAGAIEAGLHDLEAPEADADLPDGVGVLRGIARGGTGA